MGHCGHALWGFLHIDQSGRLLIPCPRVRVHFERKRGYPVAEKFWRLQHRVAGAMEDDGDEYMVGPDRVSESLGRGRVVVLWPPLHLPPHGPVGLRDWSVLGVADPASGACEAFGRHVDREYDHVFFMGTVSPRSVSGRGFAHHVYLHNISRTPFTQSPSRSVSVTRTFRFAPVTH